MTDAVYRTVAAFAARLAALGVADAVISPGSRSTPLTLCFDAQPGMRTWIQLDERSAGFFALGLGRATGRPAVLVCTSGTAAANYLPAVVEASHAGIPMIVCTADRPPELRGRGRGWGSHQTIDQVGLYGTAVRWSIDLPVPDDTGHRFRRGDGPRRLSRRLRAATLGRYISTGPCGSHWNRSRGCRYRCHRVRTSEQVPLLGTMTGVRHMFGERRWRILGPSARCRGR